MNSHEPKPEPASEAKRPYHTPQLRRLGSVRDLTLGSQGNVGDFGGTFKTRSGGGGGGGKGM